MSRRTFALGTLGTAATMVAPLGCAQGALTQVTEIWRTKEPLTVRRLLVLGTSDDPGRRLRFEGRTATAFKNAGVPAMSAQQLLNIDGPVEEVYTKPNLVKITQDNELDGAIVVRLISYDNTSRLEVSGQRLGDQPTATWNNQLKHAYAVDNVEPVKVARAETALYEVSSEKLMWSGLSETFAPEDANEAIASYGAVITKELIRRKLVIATNTPAST